MDRTTIEKKHAAKITKALQPQLGYLFRLRERMREVGYPPDDRLFLLVCKAYDAMHHLHIEMHYASCEGAGRPSESSKRQVDE